MITLGDLIHVKHGFAFKGEFFADTGDKLVLKPGNFPVGGGIRLRPGKDHFYAGTYPPEFELSPGDMVVVMTDLTQAAPILGSPAFVPQQPIMLHNQRLGLVQIKPGAEVDQRFLYYAMLADASRSQIRATATGATVRHTAPERMYRVSLKIPSLRSQRMIGEIMGSIDDLIEHNRRRVEVLEEMARAIYREWFANFRYPGYEDVPLVDSTLGPIPEGWTVGTIQSVASGDRYSTTSGPFGSKLGRKDYQADGVPVIRGANLRVGGGFDETDFVFVSEVKAAELRSAMAVQGDILVTQRGTLGQVGRIPRGARFDRYVLSQSQMKLTVDEERAAPYFIFAQLCSERAIQRFIAQAMTAGVPHVNLRLLREFNIILPPRRLQYLYSDSALPLADLAVSLERENQRLAVIRDLLLPKLVSGGIDVSALDLDALVGDRVA